MAICSTATLIPLDRLAFHLGIDPYHFNGIETSQRPIEPSCDDVWFQYDYQQSGKLSRESLGTALAYAERLTADQLGWWPLPVWVENEQVTLPMHIDPLRYCVTNVRGMNKSITTKWGYVQEIGLKTSALIEADSAVTFKDLDGDGFDETMEVAVATTVTDEEELRVYYPGKSGNPLWEIRPITSITITGGVATIRFPKYLGVLENLIFRVVDQSYNSLVVDGDDNTNFLQTVDIYRVYTDTSDQITLQAEGSCTTACEFSTETACGKIRDSRLGTIAYQRATWDGTKFVEACQQYASTQALINYRAGWKDAFAAMPTRQMDISWERLIGFYALSQLDKRLCGCSNTENIFEYQTEDLSKVSEKGSHALPWTLYSNPFGQSRAAINLLQRIHSPGVRRGF